jgi:DDE superfamily endonuclease/Tc5 transposase DNA-binding domain
MNATTRDLNAYSGLDLQNAILAYKAGKYPSIRACASAFHIPYPTLQTRLSGRTSRSHAHEHMQVLSNAEEKTLVRWITHLTRAGFPASPALAMSMAEEIRRSRFQLTHSIISYPRPIGKSWLDRFRTRHPEIKGVWTRKIEGARHKALSFDVVKMWFEAVTELRIEHQYAPDRIFNMDESGFAVGDSQSSRALVNIREDSSWKVINGRQEWITAIECISAAGAAIPPLIIFKAKYTNTAWVPPDTPPDWRFSTSNSGWTSDSHAHEWLTTVFEPATRPADPTLYRLLVMDGHGSHITAKFIAHCMEHTIDLLILPPHTSHKLQPLDVAVFSPLKRALAAETDAASRLDSGRIQRVEWTNMYIRAREKALTSANIASGWRATGLEPLSPIIVLDKLAATPTPPPLPPQTPGQSSSLDLSLLHSSPPEGTELREANALFNSQIRDVDGVPSPAKRYAERMTRALETTQSELVTIRNELAEQRELLQCRKKRRKGKRVALKGKFVFSTQEVLDIVKASEEETVAKKSRKRLRKGSISVEIEEDERVELENVSSDSESDCIIVAKKNLN